MERRWVNPGGRLELKHEWMTFGSLDQLLDEAEDGGPRIDPELVLNDHRVVPLPQDELYTSSLHAR